MPLRQLVRPEQVADIDGAQAQDALRRAIAAAFQTLTMKRAAEHADPFEMTLDHFAGCTRQAAYRLARVAPSDVKSSQCGQRRHRNLDVAVRGAMLPALAHVLGAQHTMPVTLRAGGLDVPGPTVQLYWPTIALIGALATTDDQVSGPALKPTHRYRLHLAALAVAAIQARVPVAWLAWISLHRGSGTEAVVIEPLTDDIEAGVEERAITLALASANPDDAPRDEPGPQRSITCARCPWMTRCWPDQRPLSTST